MEPSNGTENNIESKIWDQHMEPKIIQNPKYELGDGTERWNRKMAKCAGTPNSYTTNGYFLRIGLGEERKKKTISFAMV